MKTLYALLALTLAGLCLPLSGRVAVSTTMGNLQYVSSAAALYAHDNEGQTVLTQGGDSGSTWPVLLSGYLRDQSAYFDPSRGILSGPTGQVGSLVQPWSALTSLSLNDGGYSGWWPTSNGTCTGRRGPYRYGGRSLYSLPSERVAFATTSYNGLSVGWYRFFSGDAPFPTAQSSAGSLLLNWRNQVVSTKRADGTVAAVRADGSAVPLTSSDFHPEATTLPAQCSVLGADAGKVWGQNWKVD